MSAFTVRLLPARGRHAASPADPFLAGGDSFTVAHPVTAQAIAADREARRELTAQADIPTVVIPAVRETPMLAADYKSLPVFRDAVYAACAAGLRGIGMREVRPALAAPDYGLDRFTAEVLPS